VTLQRGENVIGKTLDAIARCHVAIARAPERQCVDQCFAQDRFLLADQARFVEHAAVRPGQVQVQRCAFAQAVVDLAAVDFRDVARRIEHRHYQRTVEVLMPAVAIDPHTLQRAALRCAGLHLHSRKAVTQRAIGKAQPEVIDDARMIQPTLGQVRQCLRALFQRRMVIVHNTA